MQKTLHLKDSRNKMHFVQTKP